MPKNGKEILKKVLLGLGSSGIGALLGGTQGAAAAGSGFLQGEAEKRRRAQETRQALLDAAASQGVDLRQALPQQELPGFVEPQIAPEQAVASDFDPLGPEDPLVGPERTFSFPGEPELSPATAPVPGSRTEDLSNQDIRAKISEVIGGRSRAAAEQQERIQQREDAKFGLDARKESRIAKQGDFELKLRESYQKEQKRINDERLAFDKGKERRIVSEAAKERALRRELAKAGGGGLPVPNEARQREMARDIELAKSVGAPWEDYFVINPLTGYPVAYVDKSALASAITRHTKWNERIDQITHELSVIGGYDPETGDSNFSKITSRVEELADAEIERRQEGSGRFLTQEQVDAIIRNKLKGVLQDMGVNVNEMSPGRFETLYKQALTLYEPGDHANIEGVGNIINMGF